MDHIKYTDPSEKTRVTSARASLTSLKINLNFSDDDLDEDQIRTCEK